MIRKITDLIEKHGALILVAIFFEGIASLGIEILTLRQLVPVAGTSIPVTSTAIGLFLLFLAVGYYFGGKVETHYLEKVGRNFFLAGLWSGVSLSTVVATLFFGNQMPVMLQLWLYLLVCMAPPVYWLGQTVPILSNLFKSTSKGEASGTALFFSTMGSFLGSVSLSLLLMRYLGVSPTLFLISISLVILGLNMYEVRKLSVILLFFSAVAIFLSVFINLVAPRGYFISQTAYADYRLFSDDKQKYFLVNQQAASGVNKDGSNFPYIEKIRNTINQLGVKNQEILVIGSGGFTLSQSGNPNRYLFVDIDPDISKAVLSSGFLKQINGQVISEDGRAYLRQMHSINKKYPVVVIDAYTSRTSMPSQLATSEFHREILSVLPDDGVVIYNLIFDPLLKTAFAQNSLATIQSVFGSCGINVMDYQEALSNVIIVCSASSARQKAALYNDEKNNVSFDLFAIHDMWRLAGKAK